MMLQWEQAASISRQAIGKDNSIGLKTWSPSNYAPSITRKDKSICFKYQPFFIFFVLRWSMGGIHLTIDLAWRTMIAQKI